MLADDKFKLDVASKGGKKVISLKGMVDEDAHFESLLKVGGPLVFNFKALTGINSCGVRAWVNLLKDLGSTDVSYEECPPLVVRQMNMVPSFQGKAHVLSVYVPYVCDACDTESLVLVTQDKFAGGNVQVAEAFQCTSCKKGEMELDGTPEQYFAFAK